MTLILSVVIAVAYGSLVKASVPFPVNMGQLLAFDENTIDPLFYLLSTRRNQITGTVLPLSKQGGSLSFSDDCPSRIDGRSMEYTKPANVGNKPWQWVGFRTEGPENGGSITVTTWIKFLGSVPGTSGNFGIKIHGKVINDWVESVEADQWYQISQTAPATGGDHSHVLLIFDTIAGGHTVRFADFRVAFNTGLLAFDGVSVDENFWIMGSQVKSAHKRPLNDGSMAFVSDSPPGVCGRSLEYKKGGSLRKSWQWAGYQEPGHAGGTITVKLWIKFIGSVPPKSSNFGIKIHGKVMNDWLDDVKPNQWSEISQTAPVTGGDFNFVLLIFDSSPQGTVARFTDFRLETNAIADEADDDNDEDEEDLCGDEESEF